MRDRMNEQTRESSTGPLTARLNEDCQCIRVDPRNHAMHGETWLRPTGSERASAVDEPQYRFNSAPWIFLVGHVPKPVEHHQATAVDLAGEPLA
jgi:hypothetical protein